MDRLSAARPNDSSKSDTSAFFCLATWLAPQLVALAIAAMRVPLWARFPQPGEWLALPIMLGTQSATAALLLPVLDDVSIAASVLLSGWPMALIAGSLGATPIRMTAQGELYISSWILGLAAWLYVAGRRRSVACAAAVCWSIGGALLLYLRAEFAASNGPLPGALVGPLVASIQFSLGNPAESVWLPPLCAAMIGIALGLMIRRRKRSALPRT